MEESKFEIKKFTPSGGKNLGIRKLEFVTNVVNLKRIERVKNERGRDRALLNINPTKELSAHTSMRRNRYIHIFLLCG